MNDKEKYPLLIGRSMIGNRRLHNTDEAADFICMSAEYGDTTITDVNGITVLTTYGMYIDKAVDTEYRDELLKALKPKQEELVGAENCLINGGEKEYAQNLDRRAKEYLKTEAYKNDFAEIRGIYNRTQENKSDEEITISIKGRHDPIIVPRAVVVVESMTALVLADALLLNMTATMDNVKKIYTDK